MSNAVIKAFLWLSLSVVSLMFIVHTSPAAEATPVVWTLNGITFNDGGTASGSFIHDADLAYCCGMGTVLSATVTTTAGSAGNGTTYIIGPGGNTTSQGPSFYAPLNVYLFYLNHYTGPYADYSMGFFLLSPLTNAGGTVDLDFVFERLDDYSTGAQINQYFRNTSSGQLVGTPVPEPSTLALLVCGLVGYGFAKRKLFRRS
jgi:hypothetical protein